MAKVAESALTNFLHQIELWVGGCFSVSLFGDDVDTPAVEVVDLPGHFLYKVPRLTGVGQCGVHYISIHFELHAEREGGGPARI